MKGAGTWGSVDWRCDLLGQTHYSRSLDYLIIYVGGTCASRLLSVLLLLMLLLMIPNACSLVSILFASSTGSIMCTSKSMSMSTSMRLQSVSRHFLFALPITLDPFPGF